MENTKYVQTLTKYLAGAGTIIGATSVTLTDLTDIYGNVLTMSDFGTKGYITLEPNTTNEESATFTGITANVNGTYTLTGVSSGLAQSPYTETGGLVRQHSGGTQVVITDTVQFWNTFPNKNNDSTIAATYTFTSPNYPRIDSAVTPPVDDEEFVTKKYVDDIVISGAPDASDTTKGITKLSVAAVTPTDPIAVGDNDPRVPTQAENDALAGTSGTPSSTNKYVTQNDTTNGANQTATTIAFVNSNPDTITDSGSGFVTAGFQAGQTITVTGSVSNNNTFTIASVAAGTITLVAGDSLTAESAGATVTINSATIGKLIRTGSTGGLSPTLIVGGGGALTDIVSGENLTAGQPAYINPTDSEAYISHGFKQIDSVSSYAFPTTFVGRMAKLNDSQFLALFENGTTTLSVGIYTRSTGAAVDTETVTTAFDQSPNVSTTTRPSATVCRLTDTTFVVFYAHTTTNDLYYRTGSISGSTITMDTETQYTGNPAYCFGIESYPGASDGKVVLSYFSSTGEPGAGSTTWTSTLSYLTVTTNSVTVTTTVNYTTASGSYFANPRWSAVAFTNGIAYGLFSCADAGNQNRIRFCYINTIDSSTGSGLETVNLESQTGTGVASGYSSVRPSFIGHNGKCYFGWQTNNGGAAYVNTKTVLEISQVGCRIFYQTTSVKLGGDTTVAALAMIGNECGVVVFGFVDTQAGGESGLGTLNIYIQRDKIYNFYESSSTNFYPTAGLTYSNLQDEVVFANDGDFLRTWRLPTPVDGLVISSVTAPAPVSLYNSLAITTGLTANAQYFLKDTYTTVGDMAFSGVIPVGQALSTTVMKII